MIDENFEIYDIRSIIAAGKDSEYKESAIKSSFYLMCFLHTNDLLIDLNPFDGNGNLITDTVIKKKNLTNDGVELFRQEIIDGWFNYLDRSTAPNKYKNVSRLEKGLKKIREKQQSG